MRLRQIFYSVHTICKIGIFEAKLEDIRGALFMRVISHKISVCIAFYITLAAFVQVAYIYDTLSMPYA